MANQLVKKIIHSRIVDKSSWLFKNAQMQGAQKTASRDVFRNTLSVEFCSAIPIKSGQMGVFQQTRIGGFTLVEILIAIFILSLVMTTVYVSYTGILENSRQLEEEGEIYRMARTSMERLINDLSSLQTSAGSFNLHAEKKKSGNNEFHFISFWSASHLALGENESEGRPAEISYYVRENYDGKGFSLWRADVPGTKPDETKKAEGGFIICRNIDAFRLTFYDVNERENDSWDSTSGNMPIAVKIELFLTNDSDLQKPYKFMTKIFLQINK
ncbi:MAG: prepilin-type N-terminal cleavage/methylation domain-containing protein [Syntrophaceae bacterium]|nr:prepilin-type N-terminal cleavage/methylation domain-containing protein [Syntrophaceae bacterium]